MGTPTVVFVFNDPCTQWVPLTGNTAKTGFCKPSMGLADTGGNDVTITSADTPKPFNYNGKSIDIYPSPGVTLVVGKGKSPKFSFKVVDAASSNTAYALGGVALKVESITALRDGSTSFPELKVVTDKDGATELTLTNEPDKGPNGKVVTYNFWVMAQDAAGDVGLIDPLIENQN